MRRRGVKQVIASASHKKALEEQVAHLGVAGYFQALLGVEDSLGRGKSGLAGDFLRQAGAGSEKRDTALQRMRVIGRQQSGFPMAGRGGRQFERTEKKT